VILKFESGVEKAGSYKESVCILLLFRAISFFHRDLVGSVGSG